VECTLGKGMNFWMQIRVLLLSFYLLKRSFLSAVRRYWLLRSLKEGEEYGREWETPSSSAHLQIHSFEIKKKIKVRLPWKIRKTCELKEYPYSIMPCSAVTLSLATICAVVSVALLAIAFSTDNWLRIDVKRDRLKVREILKSFRIPFEYKWKMAAKMENLSRALKKTLRKTGWNLKFLQLIRRK